MYQLSDLKVTEKGIEFALLSAKRQNIDLKILDKTGKEMVTHTFKKVKDAFSETVLPTVELPQGRYTAVLTGDDVVITKPFLVQKPQ